MKNQPEYKTHDEEMASNARFDETLLTEVDFKWLMAGQGWWVDTARLDTDPFYAAELIRFATKSQSFALRECAQSLHARLNDPAFGGLEQLTLSESHR